MDLEAKIGYGVSKRSLGLRNDRKVAEAKLIRGGRYFPLGREERPPVLNECSFIRFAALDSLSLRHCAPAGNRCATSNGAAPERDNQNKGDTTCNQS